MTKRFTYSICEMRFTIRDTASNIEKLLTNKNVIVLSIDKRKWNNCCQGSYFTFIVHNNCFIPILSDDSIYTFRIHCKIKKKHKIGEIPYIVNDFARTVCYRDLHFYITGKKKVDFS